MSAALESCLSRRISHSHASCSAASRPSSHLSHRCRPSRRSRLPSFYPSTQPRRRQPLSVLTPSSETGATVSSLQDELDAAVSAEDYQRAAQLRDKLQHLQQDSKAGVAEANRKFYAAFEHSSVQAMQEIWGHGDHVICLHPASRCISGREDVLESWRIVLRGAFQIRLEGVRIHANQNLGFVTCEEVMDAGDETGRTVATNVFEKQNGEWKIVLHQGGPLINPDTVVQAD